MTGVPLPLLLLGPILRRVEPRSVSVFVATSKAASIHLSLYDGAADSASPGAELAGVDATTTRFGAQFFATVATVTLAEPTTGPHGVGNTGGQLPLLAGHRYSYDVRITPDGGTAQNLNDLKMLEDLDPPLPGYGTADPDNPAAAPVEVCGISYTDGQLPSFVLAARRHRRPRPAAHVVPQAARLRRPGDAVLRRRHRRPHGADAGWPHQLFLTGDQIYADDVAAALLAGYQRPWHRPGRGRRRCLRRSRAGAVTESTDSLDVSTAGAAPGFRQRPTGPRRLSRASGGLPPRRLR